MPTTSSTVATTKRPRRVPTSAECGSTSCSGALLTASTALAQSKKKDKYSEPSYKEAVALTKEDAPEFVKPSPFITPNVRITGGYGLFSLTGDGADATALSGGGFTAAVAAGDEFWDVIGYYIGGRIGLFDPTTI